MLNLAFIACLAALYGAALAWACRHLPSERWQIAASLPTRRRGPAHWQGVNFTFYGIIGATAYLLAVVLLLAMMASIGVAAWVTMAYALALLLICAPAAKLVARWVEKKPQTLTIGGASFAGMVLAPWLPPLARAAAPDSGLASVPVLPLMAALAACYAIGEGLGRLACVSFGCCYGKPLCDLSPALRKVFKHWHFVFTGPNKKAAYEGGLEGRRLAPIQALSSAVLVGSGLVCLYLFLQGFFGTAFWLAVTAAMGWRAASEVLRADYRGGGRISAYQLMALALIPYAFGVRLLFPDEAAAMPQLALGLSSLWNPGVLLVLQGMWLGILVFMGRSKVTAADIRFTLESRMI